MVGMKASRPAWIPRMNELWMPMISRPIQVTKNTTVMVIIWAISQRSKVSPIRSTTTVMVAKFFAGAMLSNPLR